MISETGGAKMLSLDRRDSLANRMKDTRKQLGNGFRDLDRGPTDVTCEERKWNLSP